MMLPVTSALKSERFSESIIGDLEEAMDLMKQLDLNTEKPQGLVIGQPVTIPALSQTGIVRRISNDGHAVDVMLKSGQYMQTSAKYISPSSTQPLYKEETVKIPLQQVRNSPTDEKPKMRQLEMF
jgi:hypothetical protein